MICIDRALLREKDSNLKIHDVQEALKEHWRIRNNLLNLTFGDTDDEDSDKDEGETSLGATESICCYICKQKGHNANKGPNRKKGYEKFRGKFY